MLSSGQTLSLTVDKPAAGGRMIARHDGQIVLVGGAIPGERVRARIERVARGVAFAQTVDVEQASPDRREWTDPWCGGCLFGHMSYARQLAIKSEIIDDAFRRTARFPLPSSVPVQPSPEDGYRMRARLHARGGRLGFFREGTHEVCDARGTRQLQPATCDAIDRLSSAIHSSGLDAIREVELTENVDASERIVFLDAASALDPGAVERLGGTTGLTGLVSAFGSFGASHVADRITVAGVTVELRRHALSFFQGNRHLLADFVAHVVNQVPQRSRALDLYAGVGVFAVAAAVARGAEITAVEGDRFAAADLANNAKAGSVAAVHESVEDFLRSRRSGDAPTIIADPPRTGLSREALDGIVGRGAARLIYVSCDVATLARDTRRLVDAGYGLERIDAFDMFPNTPHIETVAVFRLAA